MPFQKGRLLDFSYRHSAYKGERLQFHYLQWYYLFLASHLAVLCICTIGLQLVAGGARSVSYQEVPPLGIAS